MIRSRRSAIATVAATLLAGTPAFAQKGASMTEAEARKAGSETILKKEGVPFIAHLPLVDDLAEARFRSTTDTTERVIALMIAAIHGETADKKWVDELVRDWQAAGHFTPDERRFVQNAKPSDDDRSQFSWRYEGVWVLLWALGFSEKLGRPDKQIDVASMAKLMFDLGPKKFRAKAMLRDRGEILDALDLVYRYHWACVDARIKNKQAPAGLDAGVVMEWHYALNWLTCYNDQDWDDISTDT